MIGSYAERLGRAALAAAGIMVNGPQPWDIQVVNQNIWGRVMRGGSLALGEAYLDGWWEVQALDEFFHHLLRSGLDRRARLPLAARLAALGSMVLNPQRRGRAFRVGEYHYDIGNDLYQAMLGKRMVYSCGYWLAAGDLDAAQEAKLALVCRKLRLQPGLRVLDIGCGWGEWAAYAAERYGVHVTGNTVSREQCTYAQRVCRGLPAEIRLEDYRDIAGRYDRVASIGMFEHVGYKNYRTFLRTVRTHLRDDGLFLLHTIGNNVSRRQGDPWLNKYIFPGGMLPSAAQISAAAEGLFVLEDWHNFGTDYDRTLLAWFANFEAAWPKLRQKYGERFYRRWKYYLLSCAGAARARRIQLWQIVFSPRGVPGGYTPVR